MCCKASSKKEKRRRNTLTHTHTQEAADLSCSMKLLYVAFDHCTNNDKGFACEAPQMGQTDDISGL